MKRKKYPIVSFFLAILFLILVGVLLIYFPPDYTFSFWILSVPLLPLMFLAFFLAMFFCFGIVFYNSRRGFFIALGLVGLLLLRFFKLYGLVYSILWVCLLIAIEVFITYLSQKPKS